MTEHLSTTRLIELFGNIKLSYRSLHIFKYYMIIFINTIIVSTIITLIWQVGKYVFLSHFRNANRPKEAECLITGNSFHDFRPWYRIVSQFNLSSSTRGYNQGRDRDRLLAKTCRWRQGSMGFGMLFPSCFPIVKWHVQKTQMSSEVLCLRSNFRIWRQWLLICTNCRTIPGWLWRNAYQSSKLLSWRGQWEGKQHLISWDPS